MRTSYFFFLTIVQQTLLRSKILYKLGNIERFNKIKEAYNYLAARQEYEDEMERTMPLQYEVTIRKKDGKIGLGMTVSEDKVWTVYYFLPV